MIAIAGGIILGGVGLYALMRFGIAGVLALLAFLVTAACALLVLGALALTF